MPAGFLNRREAATLAGVSLRAVDKAIEEKAVKVKRTDRHGTLLDKADVLSIALFARAGLPLGLRTKKRINKWVHGCLAGEAFGEPEELPLSDIVVLRSDEAFRRRIAELRRYLEGRERYIERHPEVQEGEPVVVGTRLPVRGVAERLNRGESIDDLVEDYPGTPPEAFEAAWIYAEAHPRRGRPARPWRDD